MKKAHSRFLELPKSMKTPEVDQKYYQLPEKDNTVKGIEWLMGIDYSTLHDAKSNI